LRVWVYFWGTWLVPAQNLTSYFCSATHFPIRVTKFRAYLASFSTSHFGVFWDLGLILGCLASSGIKSDVVFLLSNPAFLQGRRNFASIWLSYRDPHFGRFGGFGFFGVFTYLRCKNLTSYSCSPTPIPYRDDEISRVSRLVVEI